MLHQLLLRGNGSPCQTSWVETIVKKAIWQYGREKWTAAEAWNVWIEGGGYGATRPKV